MSMTVGLNKWRAAALHVEDLTTSDVHAHERRRDDNGQTKPDTIQVSAETSFHNRLPCSKSHRHADANTVLQLLPRPLRTSPSVAVADSAMGSEEKLRFMDEAGMEAYRQYNRFHI